jgi:hypothetical protein
VSPVKYKLGFYIPEDTILRNRTLCIKRRIITSLSYTLRLRLPHVIVEHHLAAELIIRMFVTMVVPLQEYCIWLLTLSDS